MKARLLISISGLALVLPSLRAQPQVSNATEAAAVTQVAARPAGTAQKLIQPDQILKPFNSGAQRTRVMVLLAEPEESRKPDWNNRAAMAKVRAAIKQRQDRALARLPASEHVVRHRFENFAGFSAEITLSALSQLLNDQEVLSIEPVREVHAHLAQGIPLINGMAYRSTYSGAGVAAAVVDTGVDYTHPRLGAGDFGPTSTKVLGGYNFGDQIPDPSAGDKVLVAGGQTVTDILPSTELCNPATGTWTATGSMTSARVGHTAILLPGGKVLLTGGESTGCCDVLPTAELYDPATETWSATSSMATPRIYPTATLLSNGKVLVAGGAGAYLDFVVFSSAELYDPATGTWTATGSMTTPRYGSTVTLLPSGKVLVAGGSGNPGSGPTYPASYTSELYDPATGTWSATSPMVHPHVVTRATLLPSGKVLLAGGGNAGTDTSVEAELYDPATGTWTATANTHYLYRNTLATLLPNGTVLIVAGGFGEDKCELYAPAHGTWTETGALEPACWPDTTTLLRDGKVLLTGEVYQDGQYLPVVEVYDPATGGWNAIGLMTSARVGSTATLLPGNPHGTSCAGILAGDLDTVGDYIGGVASAAKLYALKVTRLNSAKASNDRIAAAWDWCVSHKNDSPNYPILVISTSFGDGSYPSLCDASFPCLARAASNAVAAGITLLVSSGNDGYCDSIAEPACLSGVIAVGAVYDAPFGPSPSWCVNAASCAPTKGACGGCDTGFCAADPTTAANQVPSYSNSSTNVCVLAPSHNCYTTSIAGTGNDNSRNYTTNFGGTSAACPYAAGAVACLQSAAKARLGRYLTPAEVRANLTSTGDPRPDPKAGITMPRINLARAIDSLSPSPLVITPASAQLLPNGSFQLAFTAAPGATCTVLATSDPSQPLSNWTVAGAPAEVSAGQFQFTDPQATNNAQRFYRVRSP
jgi:subtilisin family serine protease